ncbi:signal recognition particle 9 kDa protein-like isoform X2 [Durio zibethinus]|uniref:Signal recognition particle 9 kDa protein-like isoform X2 n=1 Tax=Durio zibethinus TaxID=66656 RepID=A0A6P6A0T8_DURZI|nr:signal recognition particle 9 kDa protein-like isoform X2 [Durio zibethinus]
MVYITSWDEFVERTVQLFRADPESTRYCMKYRHCDGKLVLKVTDNKEAERSYTRLLNGRLGLAWPMDSASSSRQIKHRRPRKWRN